MAPWRAQHAPGMGPLPAEMRLTRIPAIHLFGRQAVLMIGPDERSPKCRVKKLSSTTMADSERRLPPCGTVSSLAHRSSFWADSFTTVEISARSPNAPRYDRRRRRVSMTEMPTLLDSERVYDYQIPSAPRALLHCRGQC